ncbi:hypothetical protein ILYODFUR_013981 [Ilyodon furcidens]|uniref:Uncharacterized protein n=1 Tax=Ilyodon furcidens TaxID=33524 RepID=A0ABV0VDU5_9TELE
MDEVDTCAEIGSRSCKCWLQNSLPNQTRRAKESCHVLQLPTMDQKHDNYACVCASCVSPWYPVMDWRLAQSVSCLLSSDCRR